MKKGIILTLGTAVISGVSIFINQFGVKMANPYLFTGAKNIVVAVLLTGLILTLMRLKEFKQLTRQNWLSLIVIGLVGGSVPFLMFFKGLSLATGSEAAYLHKFLFVFVAILAPIFLKEKFKLNYLLGFLSLFFGSALLFKIQFPLSLDSGDWLILGASLLWGIECILAKKVLSSLSGRMVAWGRMTFGALFIILFWVATGQANLFWQLSGSQWSWIILTAGLLFGYVLTWYTGLKYIPATQAAVILSLGAPITGLLEILQGKLYSGLQVQGMILMVGAVVCLIIMQKKCSPSLTPQSTH